jgi:RNA polymerase subunit RPABC4/transcription elongation factor Spt4
MATILGLLPPFIGPIIYLFFRPPEYLEDVRERELEIRAMEDRLAKGDLRCPVCRAAVESQYLVCPVCTTRLKQACVKCNAPLEALWQICPHCATPVSTPSLPGIDDTLTEVWPTPRQSTPRRRPPRKRASGDQ